MAKIQFDPELMQHIKTIYGDAELDGRTLQQLHQTWQSNPNSIRNTAQQKKRSAVPAIQQKPILGLKPSTPTIPKKINAPQQQIQNDDLRGVQGFGTAFREARKRGLTQFKWGKGVYGTQLANGKKATVEVGTPVMNNPYVTYSQDGKRATTYQNQVDQETGEHTGTIQEQWIKPPTTNMYGQKLTPEQLKNQRSWEHIPKATARQQRVKYQQGGAMANQEELQKAFMAYLIQDAAAQGIQLQSEQDLEQYAQQLGEDGIKAKYQEFMQKMQGGVMARLGAKLEYYKKLKGVCPEGEELVYFKQGGRICKACQKAQKGTKVTKKANEVDKFKAGRAQYKKDMKSAKDEASRDSVSINKYNDQEVMANRGHKGNFKNGKWVPDRTKYAKKDACGSKMKVSKCGSKMK